MGGPRAGFGIPLANIMIKRNYKIYLSVGRTESQIGAKDLLELDISGEGEHGIDMFKMLSYALDGVVQLVGALIHRSKSHWFDF